MKIPKLTWFPLNPGWNIRVSDNEFKVKECPEPRIASCVFCTRPANVILLKCWFFELCRECANSKAKKCPDCGEQPNAVEEVFWDCVNWL